MIDRIFVSEATLRTIERYGQNNLTNVSGKPDEHLCVEFVRASPTQQLARASEAGEAHPDDAMRGDAIARSKRILALVDDYHERPTADNRTALRHALHDAFTAASEAGEAVAWIDGKTLAGFIDPQNAHATVPVNLRRGEAAYKTDVPLYLAAPAQQAVTLTDAARDAACFDWAATRQAVLGHGPTTAMQQAFLDGFDAALAALQSHSEGEAR